MSNNTILSNHIMQFVNTLIFLEKRSVFTYKDINLYPSEIHLLVLISEGHAVNATAMAEKLGVTKGAISQTLSRLQKKNVLLKTKNPFNKNELTVHFTKTGREAMAHFVHKRAAQEQAYAKYISQLSSQDELVIQKFLTQMGQFLSGL
jgi:DNA-binding MarR family transcriptional regulator